MGWDTQLRVSAKKTSLDARTWNKIIDGLVVKRAYSITKDRDLRKTIGQKYVEAVTPYVPVDTGTLMRSGRATDDGRVTWSAISRGYDYAKIQYYTEPYLNAVTMRWCFEHKPPTQAYWTDRVQPGTPEWEWMIQKVTPDIVRRFENG